MLSSDRKIPENLENPIDNFFIIIAQLINPLFYKLGFNPNGITSLSLIFGILSCYFYNLKLYIIAGLSMIISYFFDVMDGNFARQYNMQTKFGDMYDHIKDSMVLLLISYLIIINPDIYLEYKIIGIIVGIILLYTSTIHLGCIEKYVKKKKKSKILVSDFLSVFEKKCKNLNYLHSYRYLGTGTANLFLSIYIIFHVFVNK